MYILYIDMSGQIADPQSRHFVMAGVAVKETAIYHVIRELDELIADSPLSLPPDIELHGVDIVRGKKIWRSFDKDIRIGFMLDCLRIFSGRSRFNMRCFGIVLEKGSLTGEDYGEYAFEQLCSRFNTFLHRENRRTRSSHRGLIVCDDSRYEETFQNMATDFRVNGTRWQHLRNLAEVPFFTNSKSTRLIQLADLIAYSLFQRFEREDRRYLNCFNGAFDYYGGHVHGLLHRRNPASPECDCAYCATRQGVR